jgi:hypothetical protein
MQNQTIWQEKNASLKRKIKIHISLGHGEMGKNKGD